jgi:metal transporter CNNM
MKLVLITVLAASTLAIPFTPNVSERSIESALFNTLTIGTWLEEGNTTIPRRCRKCPGYPKGNSTEPPPAPGFEDAVGYWGVVATICGLVLCGGVLAGLTIGYFSLDETMLAILERSGTPREQQQAKAIRPIRQETHFLLVTLLLANVVINETLPILFHSIDLEGYQAVLASTALIVMFGEIIPQAVCARYGLAIGAVFAWPVWIIERLLFPIAYPIAKILDWILGSSHETRYRRSQLKELVALHAESEHGPLDDGEVRYLRNILDMQSKTVENVYTRLENVFSLDLNTRIDRRVMKRIFEAGHSRIPIFVDSPARILGCILAKNLIMVDPAESISLSSLPLRRLPVVEKGTALWEMLRTFEQGGSHMAVVVENTVESPMELTEKTPLLRTADRGRDEIKTVLGIVCMEDVLEELLGEEIIDETDVFIDMNHPLLLSSQNSLMVSEQEKRRNRRGVSPANALHPYSPMLVSANLNSNLNSPSLRGRDPMKEISHVQLGDSMLDSQPSFSLVHPSAMEPGVQDRSDRGDRMERHQRFGKVGITAGELLGMPRQNE